MAVTRFGLLGAASIATDALVRPSNASPRATVAAIAARDPYRAREFASKHAIPVVHRTYDELLADVSIDAVYNPLPNGLHGRWTKAAIEAGKHVLCEKPFTANADEARSVAAVAAAGDRVVMEAFHWRYHPLAERVIGLVRDGTIGDLRSVRASFCFPLLARDDIRWNIDLAGGALMDAGCYPIHMLRHFVGSEPTVVAARCWERSPGIDRRAEVRLRFGDDVTGFVRTSMWSHHLLSISVRLDGTSGRISIMNPLAPQYLSILRVRTDKGSFRERPDRSTTYTHQLDAFCDAIDRGTPFPTDVADAVANMAVIDDAYRAAGLEIRQPTD